MEIFPISDVMIGCDSRDLLFVPREFQRESDLLWLPAGFHSPSLHVLNGSQRWFWHADLVFLSWLSAALRSAKQRSELVPSEQLRAVDVIRSYVCARNGVDDDNYREKLLPPGLPLPGTAILDDSVGLFDSYCGPSWRGILVRARGQGVEPRERLRQLVD